MKYFVSYFYSSDKNSFHGYGNMVFEADEEKINNGDDIKEIQKHIEDQNDLKGVIVLNYREM